MGSRNTLLGAQGAAKALRGIDTLYMVGIGGVGMSSLAVLAARAGFQVSGEDRADCESVRRLVDRGIPVVHSYGGLSPGRVAIIYSAAVPETHPALSAGAPVLSRSDLLAYLMRPARHRITVAGMHGKSTVTSMIDHILVFAGRSPTTVSGATLGNGETLRIGTGEVFVAEACEYTDSFLSLSPTVALALNLEHDHPDYFPTLADVERSFAAYLRGAEQAAVIPGGHGRLRELAGDRVPVLCFDGWDLCCDEIEIRERGYRFRLIERGEPTHHVELPLIGRHMIGNALAALLAAKACGVPCEVGSAALSNFRAPRRRLELRSLARGAAWYDDYAHHPSEIRASLSAIAEHTRGRVLCAFQAHTYTRTRAFLQDFADALGMADRVIVLPIYPARETDTLGMSAQLLASMIGEKASAAPDFGTAAEMLCAELSPGDSVAVMGAGDVDRIFSFL